MTDSATLETFEILPLSADVRRALEAMGFTHPTPVQKAVFDPAIRGKSLVVQARTGTGKTVAFGLPMVESLVKRNVKAVQALVLTPTRELALQVGRELGALAQFRELSITSIYGGAPMGKQIEALEGGAQIVCGTPGRVLDHLRRGTLDPSHIAIFVLDEADEMLSMGFAKELHAIASRLPAERQGLFFSATIPPDIERMAQAQLKSPEFITLSSDAVGALSIQHYIYVLRNGDKRNALGSIIEVENPESAIVFCNTKDETQRTAEFLQNKGYDAEWLNGDLEQKERERIMALTREGKLRFLVATDVAARGIDISHLTHVINYDFPEAAEQYVHRTGRTGRAGKTGTAISLVGPKSIGNLYMLRLTYKIRPIEKQLPNDGDLKTRAEADLVQSFVAAFDVEAHADDLALARRLLTHDDSEQIVAGLLRTYLGAREAVGENPQQLASDARRAKNPPAEAALPVAAVSTAAVLPAPPSFTPRIDRPRPETREGRFSREGREPREPRDERRDAPREARPDRGPSSFGGGRTRDDRPSAARPSAERPSREEPLVIGWTESPTPPADAAAPAPSDASRRRGGRVPHAAYTSWSPKIDEDDDQPILNARTSAAHGGDAPVLASGSPAAPRPASPSPVAPPVEERRAPERTGSVESSGGAAGGDEYLQIFVNVGRRDGARAPDLQTLLAARAGLTRELTGPIRVRDRMTFISVRPLDLERAIAALTGETIGGRALVAERARESDRSARPNERPERTERNDRDRTSDRDRDRDEDRRA